MRGRPLCVCCLLFLFVQVILIYGLQIQKDLKPSLLEESVQDEDIITTDGKVYHTEVSDDYQKIYLSSKSYQTKILVYIKQENLNSHISIGNTVRVTGQIRFFEEPRNSGEFNQKFYYQKQGIHGALWAAEYKVIDHEKYKVREFLSRARIRWKEILISVLGEKDGNTMSAILLGDKSGLDGNLKELYQKNGIGHILAISGLHMTFIGLGFYQLLRKRGFSFLTAGTMGITFLVCYSLMIGSGVASVRALVMFIVRIGADITGRVYDMLTALALAAMVILVWRPLYLFDAGFLLSFGAVLGILVISPMLELLFYGEEMDETGTDSSDESKTEKTGIKADRLRTALRQGLYGSLSINLMIFPIMLYFYFEFPVYSILLNLLVIPLMSWILGTGVIGSFICIFVMFIGEKILLVSKPILWLYEMACKLTSSLPFARIVFGKPAIWQILVYYGLLLAGCLLVKYRRRVRCHIAAAGLFTAAVIICFLGHTTAGKLNIAMLDVGQGDGIYLQTPDGITCMVDGGSSDVTSVGKYRIEPFLKSQAVGALDYVFISHGDTDHYNGIEEMLTRQKTGVRIQTLVLPVREMLDEDLTALAKTAQENGTKVVSIDAEQNLNMGEVQITCLQPEKDFNGEIGNSSSVVLSLSYKSFDMLFTGDVEGTGEENLCKVLMQKNLSGYEVLKVAHHGSKNSSSIEFLEQADPQIALISAGQNNRYGHPHRETLEKLQELDCIVKSTQEKGCIEIWTDGKSIKID